MKKKNATDLAIDAVPNLCSRVAWLLDTYPHLGEGPKAKRALDKMIEDLREAFKPIADRAGIQ